MEFDGGCRETVHGRVNAGRVFLKKGNGGMEYAMAGETVIGIKRQGLLFLPDGNLPDIGMEDINQEEKSSGKEE